MRVLLSKPRGIQADLSQEFAEHRKAYSQIIRVLMEGNYEFSVFEHRPGRDKELARQPGDGPRYIYHAETPGPGDYCLKRGPLPFLWYFDAEGYSGWSAIARDPDAQQASLGFDPDKAKAILAAFQEKLQSSSFSLIQQPDAQIEPDVAALDRFVFYPCR